MKGISNALKNSSGLIELNLENSGIGFEACKQICEALENNQKLQSLNLQRNKILENSGEVIKNLLTKNKTLEWLELGDNKLCENAKNKYVGFKNVCEGLKHNKSLVYLGLRNNGLNGFVIKVLLFFFFTRNPNKVLRKEMQSFRVSESQN